MKNLILYSPKIFLKLFNLFCFTCLFSFPLYALDLRYCPKKLSDKGYIPNLNFKKKSYLYRLRSESFPDIYDDENIKVLSDRLETILSGSLAINDQTFDCSEKEEIFACGDNWVLLSKRVRNLPATEFVNRARMPEKANDAFSDYFPGVIMFLKKGENYLPYYALGANDDITFDSDFTYADYGKFQIKISKKFPTLNKINNLRQLSYVKGGWNIYESACSGTTGATVTHELRILFIPLAKYENFFDGFAFGRAYARYGSLNRGEEEKTIRIIEELISSPEVLPAVMRLNVNMPVKPRDVSF